MTNKEGKEQDKKTEGAKVRIHNFILSCVVPIDPESRRSKGYSFIDLSSPEAAQIVIDAWHNNKMKKYPNRLNLTKFTEGYQKVTKEEREKKE